MRLCTQPHRDGYACSTKRLPAGHGVLQQPRRHWLHVAATTILSASHGGWVRESNESAFSVPQSIPSVVHGRRTATAPSPYGRKERQRRTRTYYERNPSPESILQDCQQLLQVLTNPICTGYHPLSPACAGLPRQLSLPQTTLAVFRSSA